MNRLINKRLSTKLLLIVTGSIAAYKAADLVRRLIEAGCMVRVVMTSGAQHFMTSLSFQALSGHPVHTELCDVEAEAGMGHIALAKWADLILVAPASANAIARLSQGLADDLMGAVCLATTAQLAICPAMNQQMWKHPATQRNILRLINDGALIWGPAAGEQACGDVGEGRFLEPIEIIEAITTWETKKALPQVLRNCRIVITAGATQEPIDPVRYISNHSSGKMGFALAEAALAVGADVILIAGVTALPTPQGAVRVDVQTALEMHEAVMNLERCDIFIACAAVADYRPREMTNQKIKKSAETLVIDLVKNPDILADMAAKKDKPFTVGFAAETEDLIHHAREKRERKKVDIMIANDVSRQDIGFHADNHAVTVIRDHGEISLEKSSKQNIAAALMKLIAEEYLLLQQEKCHEVSN